MTHSERAIRPLSHWLWTKQSFYTAFSICRQTTCCFVWPECRTSERISGLPAHPNVSTFPPSFLSSISVPHLHYNLPAPISGVAMCNIDWDILPCLGLSPELTCISLLNGSLCLCVGIIIMLWEFKHVLLQQHPHLSPPQPIYPKWESSLSQILLTSDCRQSWRMHTY